MSMYTDEIRALLDTQIPAVPYCLLVDYLRRRFNLSEYAAQEAIYAAARARQVTQKDNFVVRGDWVNVGSNAVINGKAFAVALEFMPESIRFTKAPAPWVYNWVAGGRLCQVAVINRGEEFAHSKIATQQPVPAEEREIYKRILVVEKGVNINNLQKAGYEIICEVDENDNYNINILKTIPAKEAWADVKEA